MSQRFYVRQLTDVVFGTPWKETMQAGGTTGLTRRLNKRFSSRCKKKLLYLCVYMQGLQARSRCKLSVQVSGATRLRTCNLSIKDETRTSTDSIAFVTLLLIVSTCLWPFSRLPFTVAAQEAEGCFNHLGAGNASLLDTLYSVSTPTHWHPCTE